MQFRERLRQDTNTPTQAQRERERESEKEKERQNTVVNIVKLYKIKEHRIYFVDN